MATNEKQRSVDLTIPCPPSINHYHGKSAIKPKGARKHRVIVYVSKAGKEFVRQVKQVVIDAGCPQFGKAKLACKMIVHLPTRAGDHHNREKPVLDALEEAAVFDDDKQVIDLRVVRGHTVKGGRCEVTLWEIS